ncbi:MAG: serine/threonine protein kinase [Anaerolineae bacterium]|nr:serine/threonine protein kinase [Anaerolineae bacterium]
MFRRNLGKYEIIDRIGRGGMAEVYRGYHAALDRYVAIKLLHSFLADDPEFKERFEREARSVARLKHPNIVQVYDFEHDAASDSYYMVMEFINGPTLKDRLFDLSAAGSLLPVAEVVRIIKTAAHALAYAHERKMIHRDVKPANLMLDEDGRVVLTDFGIAKIVTGAHITSSGGMIGTPAYMAPEQGLGQAGDERSDIYSLGVILYQLLTGRLPFDANTPLAIILKHVNEPLPLPRQFVPDLPADLEAVVWRALEKDPEARFQSAHEFAAALDALAVSAEPRQAAAFSNGPEAGEVGRATPTAHQNGDTPILGPADLPLSSGAVPGRRGTRYARVVVLAALVVALVSTGLAAFGHEGRVPAPAATLSRAETSVSTTTSAVPVAALDPTRTLSPTQTPPPTAQPTAAPSATPTPTSTSTPSATYTATPDLTSTAVFLLVQQATAPTATPNLVQTLAACDMEYIVVTPDRHDRPPSPTDFANNRLIRAGTDFEFEIVLHNTSTCAWPEGVRLSYNALLTEYPEPLVDLTALFEACPENLRPGLNFARQQQSNFFIKAGVGIAEDSPPLLFTGSAPRTFGCYYGVWELIYPNSNVRIGRPLLLTIRAWGGG